MSENFDLLTFFDSIPTDDKKSELLRALYRIDSICRENWKTMDPDIQNAIIKTVEKALSVVETLPDGLK
jgi:hypothetical protein